MANASGGGAVAAMGGAELQALQSELHAREAGNMAAVREQLTQERARAAKSSEDQHRAVQARLERELDARCGGAGCVAAWLREGRLAVAGTSVAGAAVPPRAYTPNPTS